MKRALQGWYVLGLVAAAMGCSGDPQGTEVAPVQSALSSRHACADVSEDSPLAQAACSAGILIGSAIGAAPLANDPEFPVVLDREFVYVTPENEMKWGSLQPVDSESWDFTGADAIVAHANAAGQLIKGHTLVWHAQLPSFVTEDLAQKELAKLMRKHIKETVTRYRDDVDAWDVVNEAVNGDGSLRESVFYNVLGPDYIAEAFKLADKYSRHRANACKPHKRHRKHKGHGKHKGHARREGRVCGAELYYNDYGIETVNAKSDGVRALLADLLDRGVRVDGVGIQGHIDARYAPTTEQMVENFQKFADLGLSVNVSELDVRIADIPGTMVDKLALQQQIYHRVAAACVQTEACDAITVWGLSDAYSWLSPDDPLLFDKDFNRKPAYRGMVDGLLGLPPDPAGVAPNLASSGSFETDAAGWFGFGTPGVEVIDTSANSGSKSLLGEGRTATWQGPALNLNGIVQPGFEYSASAFVKIAGAASANVNLSLLTKCAGEDPSYPWVGGVAATDTGFGAIDGGFAVPYCDLEDVVLYFNGPDPSIGIVVDDVVVRQTAEPLGEEIISNGDFEENLNGWFNFGPASISLSSDAHTGSGALLATNRTATWQGAAVNLLGLVQQGATYRITGFGKLATEGTSNMDFTIVSVCDGVTNYTGVAAANANDTVWSELVGSYQVPLCDDLSTLTLYLSGAEPGVDLLLDDVSMAQRLAVPVLEPPSPNIVPNGTFEDGAAGWYSWSGGVVGVSDTIAHSGSQSLVVTGPNLGPAMSQFKDLMVPGETYALSYWVTIEGADSANVRVVRTMDCGSGVGYSWVTNNPVVTPGTWTEVTGVFTVPPDCSMDVLDLFVEGGDAVNPSATMSLYVDDVFVAPPTNLMPNGDFETGVSGWYTWGGGVVSVSDVAYSGSQSLVVTGPNVGPALKTVKDILLPGETYNLSYWVTLDGADSANVRVVRAQDCGAGVGWSWVTNNPVVNAGSWTELTGTMTVPADCSMDTLDLYVEGSDPVNSTGTINLYVDNVSISQ